MSVSADVERIRHMLDEGHLAQADESGRLHELRAPCPADGESAPIHRISRAGRKVTEVVFRCPTCAQDFRAAPETMQLP